MPGDSTTRRFGLDTYLGTEVDADPARPDLACSRLLAGVLERAVMDMLSGDRVEAAEAEDWLFGEPQEPATGLSLEDCGLALGFEAEALRARLRPFRGRGRRTTRTSVAARLRDAA